jgi:hypothetical protein
LSERQWLYGLTADEWFHLAAMGQDSEVGPCCGNISDFREALNWLATSQGDGEDWLPASAVMRMYHQDSDGHDLPNQKSFPLLHRVLNGIRAAHPEIEQRVKEEV